MSLAKYLAKAKAAGKDAILGRKIAENLPRLGGVMGFEGAKDKVLRAAKKHPAAAAALGSLGGAGLGSALSHGSEEDDEHERRMRELGL